MKKQIKEIPSILFLMISFGVAIRVMTEGKEEVPLHWNARGEIDSWGDPWTIILLPVIALALYGLLTLLQRRPQWCNYPCKITDKAGAYKLMSGMIGHIKNLVMLLLYYAGCGANRRTEHLCAIACRSCHIVHNCCCLQKIRTVFLKPIADDCCFLGAAVVLCLGVFTWPNYATSM